MSLKARLEARPPLARAKRFTAAQVVAIAAGVIAMASGLLMWRIVGFTAVNLATGVSFVPDSITTCQPHVRGVTSAPARHFRKFHDSSPVIAKAFFMAKGLRGRIAREPFLEK